MMKYWVNLKGQRGFGDSICLYPIVKWFNDKGAAVRVFSDYPEVFRGLDCEVRVYEEGQINAGYIDRKGSEFTQFQDICNSLGFPEVPFEIDFVGRRKLDLDTQGRKLCLVNHPYPSFPKIKHRAEGIDDMTPNHSVLERLVQLYGDKFCFVLVGYRGIGFCDVDYDFSSPGHTPYPLLMNLVDQSDLILTQAGYMMHIAEGLRKKACVVFSSKSKNSKSDFVRAITPQKVLIGRAMAFYDDDWEGLNAVFTTH